MKTKAMYFFMFFLVFLMVGMLLRFLVGFFVGVLLIGLGIVLYVSWLVHKDSINSEMTREVDE